MLITYFRSSSYNTWDMCQQEYYLQYGLGLPDISNKKADKGTIVHKILETIARKTKAGKPPTKPQIQKIIQKCYSTYSEQLTHHEWLSQDEIDCQSWTWKALQYKNGMFDPRKRDIVDVEPFFDLEIPKPWAKYKYKINDKLIEGQLSIKGTIDLICKLDNKTYEIVDWKTGRRFNWATEEPKTYECLAEDPQLMLYYYAVNMLYPDVQTFMVTIFFINDGGPYTIYFDEKNIKEMEQLLRKRFQVIVNTQIPQLNKSWKCNKLCTYGKTNFGKTGQTQCDFIHQQLLIHGMDYVTKKYTHKDHIIGKYHAPGEV